MGDSGKRRSTFVLGNFLLGKSFLLLAACSGSSASSPSLDDLEQDSKLVALQAEVEKLKNWRASHLFDDAYVTLTPQESDYSFIKSDGALLPVSFESVEAYADGSRVTLRVGNTTTAHITKLTSFVMWGPMKDGDPQIAENRTERRTLSKMLAPGAWTVVRLDLAGTPPAQLGFVRLSTVSIESLSLPAQ